MRAPTRQRGYRERVVEVARNRSFHPEKLCRDTFDQSRGVGSGRKERKEKEKRKQLSTTYVH